MNNLRGLLGIRRMAKVPNALIKELIDESVLMWREWEIMGLWGGSL